MPATVTKDARRATRIVVGGARLLAWLKKQANRLSRRGAKQDIRSGKDPEPRRSATGWDVA